MISNEEAVNILAQQLIDVGTLVEVHCNDDRFYGVVKWVGLLPPTQLSLNNPFDTALQQSDDIMMAGIEMEEELQGGLNGWHQGTELFECPEGKGVFLPFTHFQPDRRFEPTVPKSLATQITSTIAVDISEPTPPAINELSTGPSYVTTPHNGDLDFGGIECPAVSGFEPPIHDFGKLFGRNRGIQGHQNSCYLDATLFAMFSFTSIFDCMLYRPANKDDIPEYGDVQKVLREEIVNPLRKCQFVRADKVMKLREFLDDLTSVKGLMSEEKDPEELLNSLLSQTCTPCGDQRGISYFQPKNHI